MFTGTQADIQQSYFPSMGGTLQSNSFQEFMTESVCTPGEGNGTPLQYSCLENLMDRGAW